MKKKNLLKCLALTSMLALSVGALASCGTQGAQGEKGDTGATGATGAPGKDGVDGKDGTNGTNGTDGKTYLPVIVLNNAVGTVSQDKYFVEVGESFTLSWENKGTGATLEVMSELKINGEAVDMEVGDSSYTYTAVDTDKGFQVTSCTYGTLIAYGEGLVTDHYDELADADKNLKTSEGVDQTGKLASYVGDDLYTQLGTSLAAITAADAPAKTVAERLALIKTAVATEITNIDTKYASLIKSAKEDAVADLKVMYAAPATPDTLDAAGRKDMTKADRAAMLTSATAEVNACTTLYGIGSLVKEDSAVNTYTDGKFNILEGNRKAAFTDVNGALAAVVTKDGVDGALDTAEHIAATRIVLADYGITELPSDVAASYITKISAASELPFVKDSTTDVALGKEGKKAVEDCYAGIISSLKDNIISIYYKEVEKSSVLDSNGKTTAKSLIFNTVTNWFADPTSTTTINGILDVDVPTSCVSSVEEALTNDNYTAYNIERKGWIVTENKAAIDEKIASIIAGDTVYSGLISAAATTDNHYNAHKTGDVYDNTGVNVNITGDVQKAALDTAAASTTESVKDIKGMKTANITAITTAYTAALTLYEGLKSLSLGGIRPADVATGTGTNCVADTTTGLLSGTAALVNTKLANVSTAYNKDSNPDGAQTLTAYKAYVDTIEDTVAALKTLDTGYAKWLASTAIAADTVYITVTSGVGDGRFLTDTVHDAYVVLQKAIAAGTKTEADATAFVSGLTTSYKASIVDFQNSCVEVFNQYVNAKIAAATPDSALDMLAVQKVWLPKVGNKVTGTGAYDYTNGFTGAQTWLTDAKAAVLAEYVAA